jgi:small subunit ribosomal protein S6
MPDALPTYELTYIVNPVLSEDQIKELGQRYETYIKENGGTILQSNDWGSRRLAYPILKKRNGYYFNVFFQAPGGVIARLERAMEIEDDVLRYLTLRQDAKMLRHFERNKERTVEGSF